MAPSTLHPRRPCPVAPVALGVILAVFAVVVGARAQAKTSIVEPALCWPSVFFLVALTVAGHLSVTYHYRGKADAIDLFEAVLAPAIFVLPPAHVVVVAALAKAVSQATQHATLVKTGFNVAQWSAAAAAGSATFGALADPAPRTSAALPSLLLAMLVVVGVNLLALLTLFALLQPPPRRYWLKAHAPALALGGALASLVSLVWGVLFTATFAWAPAVAPLFLVPMVLLHRANHGYAVGRVEQQRLLLLQRATHALAIPADPRSGVPAFLAEVGAGFGGEAVDLVLPEDWGRWVLRQPGPNGVNPGQSKVHPAYGERWQADGRRTVAAVLLEAPSVRAGRPIAVRGRTEEPVLAELLAAEGWRDVLAAPLVQRDGRIAGLLCVYNPVTPAALPERELSVLQALADELGNAIERSDLLRAVAEERAKLAHIVEGNADGIATFAPDGRVHSWNPALERITGWPATLAVGTRGLELLQALDDTFQPVTVDGWDAEQATTAADIRIVRRDGEERWLSCSYSAERNGQGERAQRLILMARDVTELRRAQQVYNAETAVFAQIASGAPLPHVLRTLADAVAPTGSGLCCAVLLCSEQSGRGSEQSLRGSEQSGRGSEPSGGGSEQSGRGSEQSGRGSEQSGRGSEQSGQDAGEDQMLLWMAAATDPDLMEAMGELSTAPGWGCSAVAVRTGRFAQHPDPGPTEQPDAFDSTWEQRSRQHRVGACWAVPVQAPDGAGVLGVVTVLARGTLPAHAPQRELLDRAAQLTAIAVERSRWESRLAHQATHDDLTGLPNRALFLDRVQHALDRAGRDESLISLLFLDLDRFKAINDTLGHEAGDHLLMALGRRLVPLLRPGDTVARLGGDEFTILCDNVADPMHALGVAERVRSALAEPFLLGGSSVGMTASMGVATSRESGSAQGLINDADAAMYRAKERGGNRCESFEDIRREPAANRISTQDAMYRGLERAEFEVFYQPVVPLSDRSVLGAEALLRWRHPERGLLAPAAFIGLAESSGLIVPIGAFVLRTACLQARAWQLDAGPEVPSSMSINLSARQFSQPDLAAMVADALTGSGADPAGISFEITESAAMDDAAAAVATLHELKALGVGLIIDDFGTGYSSLTYLKRFPVDGLKVDQSFVSGLDSDVGDTAIVTAVIDLAHSLGIVAIAEGVETAAQLERLRALGCDCAQGYHIGRPRPAVELSLSRPSR